MNNNKIRISDAILSLLPDSLFVIYGNKYDSIEWFDDRPQPTEEEIQAKLEELQAAEPLRLLRQERDKLLQQTDWRATIDYPGTDQEAWLSYRQALRDLPSNQTPELDENGNIINITWPEEP